MISRIGGANRFRLLVVAAVVWLLESVSHGFLFQNGAKKSIASEQPWRRIANYQQDTALPSTTSTTQLYANKLWDRLQIEEDPEPFWYLINCVAGVERDLLYQCREVTEDMEDAIKFVVPTETKTRSHGANRMVTETKVKYQGYVFGKLRLCPEVYEAIQGLDLCRSWMGTVNHKGYKKLPPVPVALNDMEIENFGLEDLAWEKEEPPEQTESGEDVIMDDAETDAQEQEALKVYLGLRVNDMVKVTKSCKFHDEDATVRRLKDGKILCRFFTYGTMYEEWMEPGDVRKLTELEVLKGMTGPSQPITQYEFDGKGRGRGRDGNDRRGRQSTRTFGSRGDLMSNVQGARGGPRNRRQDRMERGQNTRGNNKRDFFGRTQEDRQREERNWDWYKDQKRNKEGMVEDEDFTYRPGSRGRDNDALSDVDAQWGRPPSQRQQRRDRKQQQQQGRQGQQDWSAFVSPSSSSRSSSSSSRSSEDDFFASLMSDLNKDASSSGGDYGSSGNSNNQQASQEEDDFFASLVAEINNEDGGGSSNDSSDKRSRNKKPKETPSSLSTDDFFASLAAGIDDEGDAGGKDLFDEDGLFDLDGDKSASSGSTGSVDDEDDFFASLEKELGGALSGGNIDGDDDGKMSDDDFFATLEDSLSSSEGKESDDSDDFFASLGDTLSSELQGDTDNARISTDLHAAEEKQSSPKEEAKPASPSPSPAPSATASPTDLSKLTVPKLKEMLRERGLKVSGKKAELIERLSA